VKVIRIDISETDSWLTCLLHVEHSEGCEETYDCALSVCASAVCSCRNVAFICSPVDSEDEDGGPKGGKLKFSLDPIAQSGGHTGEDPTNDQDDELAELVAEVLSEDQWNQLQRVFFSTKQDAYELMDPDELVVHFDHESLEGTNQLVSFRSVFRRHARFSGLARLFAPKRDSAMLDRHRAATPR